MSTHGHVFLVGEITSRFRSLVERMITTPRSDGLTRLTLHLHSGGGLLEEAWALHELLTKCGLKVTTNNLGEVGSAAVSVYAAGTRRLAAPITFFRVHDVGYSPGLLDSGYLGTRDLKSALSGVLRACDQVAKTLAASSSLGVAEWRRLMRRETQFGPKRARTWGLLTAVRRRLMRSLDALSDAPLLMLFCDEQLTPDPTLGDKIVDGVLPIEIVGGFGARSLASLIATIVPAIQQGIRRIAIRLGETNQTYDPRYLFAAYNLLRGLPLDELTVYAEGRFSTGPTVLLLAGTQRLVAPRTELCLGHYYEPLFEPRVTVPFDALRAAATSLRMKDSMADRIAKRADPQLVNCGFRGEDLASLGLAQVLPHRPKLFDGSVVSITPRWEPERRA